MKTTLRSFDRRAWINRFGQALEDTAATARPIRVPFRIHGVVDRVHERREEHQRYREMAQLTKTDPYAAKLFDESHLWLDTLPDDVQDLLLEHPVIERACSSGPSAGLRFRRVLGGIRADLKSLIRDLAKLSVRVGGPYAATVLHRFLVAAENRRLHAHDITVLHGLELDEPIPLGRGAFLASYDAVRKRFGLPEDPEPWLRRDDEGLDLHPGRLARASSRGLLVRQVRWGLAASHGDRPDDDFAGDFRYRFPEDHRVDADAGVFEERETMLHLLSIAVRSKLVSHTFIDALPPWMARLNPNLQTRSPGGGRGVFDVWPADRVPSTRDLDAFAAAARGWLTHCAGKGDRGTELAIRRTAGAFGIAAGRFGVEDRLLDAGIALEAMYGPYYSGIRYKISARAGWLLGNTAYRRRVVSQSMKSFYDTRSKVVHGSYGKDRRKRELELAGALETGRKLARRTLFALLARGPVHNESQWDALLAEQPARGDGA